MPPSPNLAWLIASPGLGGYTQPAENRRGSAIGLPGRRLTTFPGIRGPPRLLKNILSDQGRLTLLCRKINYYKDFCDVSADYENRRLFSA